MNAALLQGFSGAERPSAGVPFEADMRVIVNRRRCRKQNQARVWPPGLLCSADQLFADAQALVRCAHSKVGEIRGITEIRERSRDSYKQCGVPGAYD